MVFEIFAKNHKCHNLKWRLASLCLPIFIIFIIFSIFVMLFFLWDSMTYMIFTRSLKSDINSESKWNKLHFSLFKIKRASKINDTFRRFIVIFSIFHTLFLSFEIQIHTFTPSLKSNNNSESVWYNQHYGEIGCKIYQEIMKRPRRGFCNFFCIFLFFFVIWNSITHLLFTSLLKLDINSQS